MVTDVVHKVMVDAVVKMIMLWVKILKSCQSRSGLLCPYQIPEWIIEASFAKSVITRGNIDSCTAGQTEATHIT